MKAGRSERDGGTLIRGGRLVMGQEVAETDLLIQGEEIAAIAPLPDEDAHDVVDARGLLVLPGGVDTHVHFNDVFMGTVSVHDYFTGTRAAVFGGTTTIIERI